MRRVSEFGAILRAVIEVPICAARKIGGLDLHRAGWPGIGGAAADPDGYHQEDYQGQGGSQEAVHAVQSRLYSSWGEQSAGFANCSPRLRLILRSG